MSKKKTERKPQAWKKKWQKAHNKRRKDRYHSDPEYREKIIKANMEKYREENGVVGRDCRENLHSLEEFGGYRDVLHNDEVVEILCFTVAEIAEILGDYSTQVIYRWIRDERLPDPIIPMVIADSSTGSQKVYHEDEVTAILKVMGEHQQNYMYYKLSHEDTVDKVWTAVEKVRKKLGVE